MSELLIVLIYASSMLGGRVAYLAVGAFSIWGGLRLISDFSFFNNKFTPLQLFVFVLPFFVFCTWCYGVLKGLAGGVTPAYAFSNFFGLSLYLLFYPFFFYVSVKSIKKVLLIASFFACVFAIYSVFSFFARVGGGGEANVVGLSGFRTIYSVAFLYVTPFLLLSMVSIFLLGNGSSRITLMSFFLLALYSFVLIVPAMSKGYILVFLFLGFLIFSRGVIISFGFLLVRSSLLFLTGLAVFFVLVLLFFTDIYDVLIFSFSSNEPSNSVRSEQFSYLISEWNLQGAGLGSGLVSGYSRDDSGYGFELTYINLINKLGVFSIPLFLSYIVPVFLGLKLFLIDGDHVRGAWVLGLMAYLIPGAGNPLLLAPVFVFSHFAAIKIAISADRS
ncbi:hypothetical protein K8U54_22255 [Pseudomonas fulva]|uniref:hypothetical protein n=1 Tax=Pseudomonas fulva TaxID=47880 RepID=UPI00201DBA7D|nr:hypothetical protein [Pseudomonas fulva]UQY34398.1 hypothetical protein K8U54_22255 [Pseudomonas fulva]